MKKIFLLLILTLITFGVKAMQPVDVKITNTEIKKENNQLSVNFDIVAGKLGANNRVKVTPIIYDGNNNWQALDPIVLSGRSRNIYDKRTDVTLDNVVVVKRGKSVKYTTSVPYQSWMQYIALSTDIVSEGCCNQTTKLDEETIGPTLVDFNIVPYYDIKPLRYELSELEKYDLENPFLHPMEDYSKRYDILIKDRDKGSSTVIFTVGSHKLDMNFQGNKEVLDAIKKAFKLINEDPNARLKHIMIAGYASPEGTLAFNTALAQRRAETVKSFIKDLFEEPNEDSLFELYNGREDWAGLREKVENSDMEDKDAILTIIDSYTMEQEVRKTQLKKLKGGTPYKYMLQNFYPSLRSAGYVQVYYEIDRTATVATAVTDEFGRTTWVDPDSPKNRAVTIINKALELMVDNKFDEALGLLLEFKDDSRSWNNIGVCYMMTKEYNEAEGYFKRALEIGDVNAPKNIEQIEWARKLDETIK